MSIRSVVLVGASGILGGPILDSLVKAGLDVTVLQRRSSNSKRGEGVARIVKIGDDMAAEDLEAAFKGHDACIIAMTLDDLDLHIRLADAAVKAGVKRYFPADFGSYESSTEQALNLLQLSKDKMRVREQLKRHAANHPTFTHTSIVCGHYLDWGLQQGFLHFDLKSQTADMFNDGEERISFSTLAYVADAVVKILQDNSLGANQVLFLRSLCISQKGLLSSIEKATGTKWKTNWLESEKFIVETKKRAEGGDGDADTDLVFILGLVEGDWEKHGFEVKDLGLPTVDLDNTVAAAVSGGSK